MSTTLQTGWTGGREPLANPDAESARVVAYWAWLQGAEVRPGAARAVPATNGGHWVALDSPADADFEARHMRHSIGHSWDKYSSLGHVISLRDIHGKPQATILVAGDVVVHAREQENARLSVDNMRALNAFAAVRGLTVKDDTLPFDSWDGDAPNTELRFLHRSHDNHKEFARVVFEGRLTTTEIMEIANSSSGRSILPEPLGLPDLRGGNTADLETAWHEIQAIGATALPSTHGHVVLFLERWREMDTAQPELETAGLRV